MKLIVFYPCWSTLSRTGYSTSIRIGYLLNGFLATAGVQEEQYSMMESMKTFRLPGRIQLLLKNYHEDAQGRKSIIKLDKMLKSYNNTKHKSTQMIIDGTIVKKYINEFFDLYMENMSYQFETLMGIKGVKDLINPDHFYFYHLPGDCATSEEQLETTVLEIMQLMLPDPEKENPIFFIDCHNESRELIDVEINAAQSDLAADPSCCYGSGGFIFPWLAKTTMNELATAREQMEEPTREFRSKIDQWATICYQNPTTTAGLEFFRENLIDYLPTLEDEAVKCPILKNVSDLTREKNQSQIIIGQAPIETIWKIYRDTKGISDEQYKELMTIKSEQYPKYEGRWPVMFLKCLADDLSISMPAGEEVQAIRKSIAVD